MIEYCFLYLSFILVKPNGQKSRCQLSDKWGRCGLCHMWGHHPNTSGKMTQTESGIDHERCLAVSPTACERHQYADATCENYSSGATLDGTARTGRAVLSILSHFKSGTNQSEICGRRRLRQFYLRGWMLVTPLTENSDKLSSTQQQGGDSASVTRWIEDATSSTCCCWPVCSSLWCGKHRTCIMFFVLPVGEALKF